MVKKLGLITMTLLFACVVLTTQARAADRWELADHVASQVDASWSNHRYSNGVPSIRSNAMMLQIHARAAVSGHQGPARNDQRVNDIAAFLSSAPVLVTKTKIRREVGNFPHVPAFASTYSASHPELSPLHPSADALVIQALRDAYFARDQVDMPVALQQQVKRAIAAVARGNWYKKNQYAENQVNWNADVAMADWEVNAYRPALGRYRQSLLWLATYAHRPAPGEKLASFSTGYGFHYGPTHGYSFNDIDSVEYANLVHGALAYYPQAIKGGMKPLGSTYKQRLDLWSDHVLYNWTHAGYLNWDSALGDKRRHLDQYWGFALWSLARSSASMPSSKQQVVDGIVANAIDTYQTQALGKHQQTMFSAPNGFKQSGKTVPLTTMRFALADITNFGRSQSSKTLDARNFFTHDKDMQRLAVSTPTYNAAIVGAAFENVGGIDLVRLFDAKQRPLTPFGIGDRGQNTNGLRMEGSTVVSSESGSGRSAITVAQTNQSKTFQTLTEKGIVRSRERSITVQNVFAKNSITTRYYGRQKKRSAMTMTIATWNRHSKCTANGHTVGKQFKAVNGRSTTIRCQTPEGAKVQTTINGLPKGARIYAFERGHNFWAPKGSKEIRIRFQAINVQLQRTIEF